MFRIDLNDSNYTYGNEDANLVSLAHEINVASEGLLIDSAKLDLITVSAENIISGAKMANAIAAKGDQSTAVAVAHESLKSGLAVIGQAQVADMVLAGTEDITVATEGIKDTLKKMWAKTKEFVKKIWEWVKKLVSKVKDFIMGALGKKSGLPAFELYEELVKAKQEGKKLGDAKLKDEDKEKYGEHYDVFAKITGKKFGVDGITEIMDLFNPAMLEASSKVLGKAISDSLEDAKKLAESVKSGKDVPVSAVSGKFSFLDPSNFTSKEVTFAKELKIADEVKKVLNKELKIKEDEKSAFCVFTTITANNVKALVLVLSSDATKKLKELKSQSTLSDIASSIDSIYSDLKVETFTIDKDKLDAKDAGEKALELIDVEPALKLINVVQDRFTAIGDFAKYLDNAINSSAKGIDQVLDIMKDVEVSEKSEKGFNKLIDALRKYAEVVTKVSKEFGLGLKGSSDLMTSSDLLSVIKLSLEKYKK